MFDRYQKDLISREEVVRLACRPLPNWALIRNYKWGDYIQLVVRSGGYIASPDRNCSGKRTETLLCYGENRSSEPSGGENKSCGQSGSLWKQFPELLFSFTTREVRWAASHHLLRVPGIDSLTNRPRGSSYKARVASLTRWLQSGNPCQPNCYLMRNWLFKRLLTTHSHARGIKSGPVAIE